MKIFIICGKARHGKDTTAEIIDKYFEKNGKKVINLQYSSYLKEYAKKGDKIEITGKLRSDNWKDDEGKSHNRSYVVADTIKILTSRTKQKSTNIPEITDEDLPF